MLTARIKLLLFRKETVCNVDNDGKEDGRRSNNEERRFKYHKQTVGLERTWTEFSHADAEDEIGNRDSSREVFHMSADLSRVVDHERHSVTCSVMKDKREKL